MDRSSLLLAVLLAAFVGVFADLKKEQEATNGYYTIHWNSSSYAGLLPSITTGEANPASFRQVTNAANTSSFAIFVDNVVYSQKELSQLLVDFGNVSKAQESTEDAEIGNYFGIWQDYGPFPVHSYQNVSSSLYIRVWTEVFGYDMPSFEADSGYSYATIRIEGVFNGSQSGDYIDVSIRLLLDINVNGDDGPSASPSQFSGEKRATVSSVSSEADLVQTFDYYPPAFVFSSTREDSRVSLYQIFAQVRNDPYAADTIEFVSWESAYASSYNYTLDTSMDITDDAPSNLDSALLLYWDSSLCSGQHKGLRLYQSPTPKTLAAVRLFVVTGNEPDSNTCPACGFGGSSNVYGDRIRNDNCLSGADDYTISLVGATQARWCSESQTDSDNDGVGNACDTCVYVPDPTNANYDGDYFGDVCDNCPKVSNNNQSDIDKDGFGDVCDNCMYVANDQADFDKDTIGDACDNCLSTPNLDQLNFDNDSRGDACDNCPTIKSENFTNSDTDTFGDICDNCPYIANNQSDLDGDGVGDACDNCLKTTNPDQQNHDNDTFGDACDNCPYHTNENQLDFDNDTIGDACDNCKEIVNTDQANYDNDAWGDVCDNCPRKKTQTQLDSDGDGFGDGCDVCPFDYDPDQLDPDHDGVGIECDNCPSTPNNDQLDSDADGLGNHCDKCPYSRWTYEETTSYPAGVYVPNFLVKPGCWVSDYDDQCMGEYCVVRSDPPIMSAPRLESCCY